MEELEEALTVAAATRQRTRAAWHRRGPDRGLPAPSIRTCLRRDTFWERAPRGSPPLALRGGRNRQAFASAECEVLSHALAVAPQGLPPEADITWERLVELAAKRSRPHCQTP